MNSSNPVRARVVAEISIHEAVAAVEHFAANFPADRQSFYLADRLNTAATTIMDKAQTQRTIEVENYSQKLRTATMDAVVEEMRARATAPVPVFNSGSWTSGQIQSINVYDCNYTMCHRRECTRCYPPVKTVVTNTPYGGVDTLRVMLAPACCEKSTLADGTLHDANCPVLLESLDVREDTLCRECLVWHGPEDPTRHGVRCSQRSAQ